MLHAGYSEAGNRCVSHRPVSGGGMVLGFGSMAAPGRGRPVPWLFGGSTLVIWGVYLGYLGAVPCLFGGVYPGCLGGYTMVIWGCTLVILGAYFGYLGGCILVI